MKHTWITTYIKTEWRRFFGVNVSMIDPLLFVGGQFTPQQWLTLYSMGIRAVLNLQDEHEDCFMENFPEFLLRLPVVDHHAPTQKQLACAVSFITRAHTQELPVFIHCHAGIGRAPTVAAAYLIAQRGMDKPTALHHIRVARPNILLTRVQHQCLTEWEQHVGTSSDLTWFQQQTQCNQR